MLVETPFQADLIEKYNVPGPRYTSYPTVPYWQEEGFSADAWMQHVRTAFEASNQEHGISLYIHLPYCSTACHYCGCNMKYTQNHAVEEPYIDLLLREWEMYRMQFTETPRVVELHLGGGTPTFFSPENLFRLLSTLLETVEVPEDKAFSFEASPTNTTREHLEVLYDLGFERLSLGVQDFDPVVQEAINRIQSPETVDQVVRMAREIGYSSVNFDLIYGLPKQTERSIRATFDHIRGMAPDRIAYYSYAHVPWVKGVQRNFTEADLPRDHAKRQLYNTGKACLEEDGYVEIGMDHFALPHDSLCQAARAGNLHRNFMGYTTQHTELMLGLGMSSIGDSWGAFAQNHKRLRDYRKAIEAGELPVFRGHILTDEDRVIRKHILNLMCRFTTEWSSPRDQTAGLFLGLEQLEEMERDGLVVVEPYRLTVTEAGLPFVRNVCMALDARLHRDQPEKQIFSSTI